MGKIKFLLFLLFLGVFLYYWGKPHPLKSLQNDIWSTSKSIKKPKTETNKEPTTEKEESSSLEEKSKDFTDEIKEEVTKKVEESVLDAIKNKLFSDKKGETNSEETSDLDKYIPFSKNNQEIVRHKAFVLNYREEYEQASWVLHRLSSEAIEGHEARSNEFIEDPLVETGSAVTQDYSRSGFDRGHLCPAGDFKHDKELQDETFYMSNMSPQVPDFNRGIWNHLESKVRTWVSTKGEFIILTGPILKTGLERIGRINHIAVPKAFYKIVYDPAEQKAIAFLVPNEGSSKSIKSFATSIDKIEELTGIDFFEKLPDTLEQKIESKNNIESWYE
jgi:endonuclease G, mitochondrial